MNSSPFLADLMDHHQSCSTVHSTCNSFRDFGGITRFHGQISTVKCFEKNPLIRKALSAPGAGKVLVVDGGGSLRCALLGDQIATLGAENGWQGVIINGCIRDSVAVRDIPLGVKALSTNPAKSSKEEPFGETNVPVEFAGLRFIPGHWVYADEDGIIVSEHELSIPVASSL